MSGWRKQIVYKFNRICVHPRDLKNTIKYFCLYTDMVHVDAFRMNVSK